MDSMAEEQNRTLADKFMLRMPDGMRDRIRAVAEANNRSMNSEIVATLEEKYPPPDEFNPFDYISDEWMAKAPGLDAEGRVALAKSINARLSAEGIEHLMLAVDDDKLSINIKPR